MVVNKANPIVKRQVSIATFTSEKKKLHIVHVMSPIMDDARRADFHSIVCKAFSSHLNSGISDGYEIICAVLVKHDN